MVLTFLKVVYCLLACHHAFVQSSLVVDSASQRGVHIADYCPIMEFCPEGAHVMCMYYDPNRVHGPRCSDPKNISMTSELAVKLLEVTNAIRGKVAMGTEKGKGNEKLPRAYGMFKLQWDNELATFAQVLANQCLMRHDMCRATKKFPNPGQTVSKIRFTLPEWYPAGSKSRHYPPGLTESKLTYSITQSLRTWYSHKSSVTPHMLTDYPDWSLNPNKDSGRLYMEMITGHATHMGCGISAFVDYAYNNNRSPLNFNAIQIVCNYSERPKTGKPVYDMEPGARISRCGCPPLTIEDENCLCSYIDENDPRNKDNSHCKGGNCEQPVILLPIFAIEDAPPSKLLGKHTSDSFLHTNSLELISADLPGNHSRVEHPIVKALNGVIHGQHLDSPVHHSQKTSNRRSDKSVTVHHKQSPANGAGHASPRKTSIFSRSILIGAFKANNPFQVTLKDPKKVVVQRKDFSKAKNLANDMETHNFSNIQYKSPIPDSGEILSKRFSSVTKNLDHAEDSVIVHTLDNHTLHYEHDELHHHDKDRGSNIMNILDKLEKEVQHINLRGNKKELFDARIRKIYDSVLRKSSGSSTPKPTYHSELESTVNRVKEKEDQESHKDTAGNEDNLFDDIGKTIVDDIGHHLNDNTQHNNLEEGEGLKNRRTRTNSRIDELFTERDLETNYNLRRRENAIKSPQSETLLSNIRDSNKEYKPHRFPEHRQSYKSQDHSYENFQRRLSVDEGMRREKRLKHTRDYYSRNTNSVESVNNNHYRRQATEDVPDDILSPERRKYYQDRLDNLERKIHNTRSHKYRKEDVDYRRRAMRVPSDDEAQRRPSINRLDHLNMRERSRSIHGY